MSRLVLGFVVGLLTAAATLSYAGKGNAEQCLGDVTPIDGYRYFSGNKNPLHNHPAMYASGYAEEAKLTVIGVDVDQSFPAKDLDAAFAAYRTLLVSRGYLPAP